MKKNELQQIIKEELSNILNEATPSGESNRDAVSKSKLYAVLRSVRSASEVLAKLATKASGDKTKTADDLAKETDAILAKYGLKKLPNFDQLYKARLGRAPGSKED